MDAAKEPVAGNGDEHGVGKRAAPGHYINAALIDDSPERPDPPVRSSTPFSRSPITLNSALIDKSASMLDTAGKRTPPRRTIDPRYNVNPALIDDRVEVPPRAKRVVKVDKSCIDTTSIFDQSPPRSHLEPRKYKNAEGLKHVAATEIMQNLKKLQTEAENQLDDREKYSLPEEYFAQQLKYIELLENQLKNVILAEEEERAAFEEFQTHVKQKMHGRASNEVEPEASCALGDPFDCGDASEGGPGDDGSRVESESWQEKSENAEEGHSEMINKHGQREFLKKMHHGNGFTEEESCERIERVEQRSVMSKEEDKVPKASDVTGAHGERVIHCK